MDKMKLGDILALKNTTTLIGKLIKYFTKSSYSHICVYIGNGIAIEADGYVGKINYRDINDYKNNLDIYTCDMTGEQRKIICKYAISQIGQKYDYMLIFVLFLRKIFKLKIRFKDSKSDICSELCNDAYLKANMRLIKKRYPSPQDVVSSPLLRFNGTY